MNSTIDASSKHAFHTISNVEFTGVYDNLVYNFAHTRGSISWYHFFIRYGDKVYMEVKGVGDIVISFAELQKNRYWKYYYDLSLMLTNNEDKNMVIQYHKYGSEYLDEQIYQEPRFWSFNTAYIETSMNLKSTSVKNYGNICYYKINPYDLENMEYTSVKNLEIFEGNYMITSPEIKNKGFNKMCVIYNNLVIDYHANIMEKELEDLSTIIQDKKNVITLTTLLDKEDMNGDILMIIYNNLVSTDGDKKYKDIINKIGNYGRLERNAQILAA
uniref:Uncharacterized protein n=1 Tax=viral metagenome TaxID=1070528 RepID=A0A6C0L9N6_9ZZZZ